MRSRESANRDKVATPRQLAVLLLSARQLAKLCRDGAALVAEAPGESHAPPGNTTSPSREYSPGVMNDETKLALEHLAKQAKIVERIQGMLATALDGLRTLKTSAELQGASVEEIAEASGLSDR